MGSTTVAGYIPLEYTYINWDAHWSHWSSSCFKAPIHGVNHPTIFSLGIQSLQNFVGCHHQQFWYVKRDGWSLPQPWIGVSPSLGHIVWLCKIETASPRVVESSPRVVQQFVNCQMVVLGLSATTGENQVLQLLPAMFYEIWGNTRDSGTRDFFQMNSVQNLLLCHAAQAV